MPHAANTCKVNPANVRIAFQVLPFQPSRAFEKLWEFPSAKEWPRWSRSGGFDASMNTRSMTSSRIIKQRMSTTHVKCQLGNPIYCQLDKEHLAQQFST
jgi:hypothetical protein